MAKPTGFLDYSRQEIAARPPQERLKDWREIKQSSLAQQESLRDQAARCMDCSIPFCHSGIMLGNALSGCPLHNLMPECNDLIYQGLDQLAYLRLSQTNNFPEFTSHVCPAPCEGACCAGQNGDPVSIRALEQYMSEIAFANGWVVSQPPAKRRGKKVAVVGSGPAGLACADELNKAGYQVTVFERADRAGGLLMYGIPNMKLPKELLERRLELLAGAGVEFKLNSEVGRSVSSQMLLTQFDATALCTGSTLARDLAVPGRELGGIYFAKEYLHNVTHCLLDGKLGEAVSAEGKDVVVIGGGDTGTDCVATALRQGARSVRQIEIMPCLPHSRAANNPWPQFPRVFKTDYGQEEALAVYGRDPREYCVETKRFTGAAGQVEALEVCQVAWEDKGGRLIPVEVPNTRRQLPAQLILLALGFIGGEQQLFDEFKLTKSSGGSIATANGRYQTARPGVFAAGDARRGQSLVVWAIAEGRGAAKEIDEYLKDKVG
jgi:glutamate synthase (NADPH/NADH) small chain